MLSRRRLIQTAAGAAGAAAVSASLAPAVATAGGGKPAWERLRRHLRGELIRPGDPRYDRVRQAATVQYDRIRPAAVVCASTERDVATALRFAQDHGVHLVPRSGGHSQGGYSSTTGIVLDLRGLNGLRVTGRRTVVAGAGVQQVDALEALSPQGLSLVGGRCPNVALGGFLQGGGIGWQSRRHGLGSDQLERVRVVLADGRTVTASEHQHPDLFWALRGGGGGNFGVVTAYETRPSAQSRLVNYALTWPWESAAEVVTAWQEWIGTAPRDLGSGLALLHLDSSTGAPILLVNGAWLGREKDLGRQLSALTSMVGSPPTTSEVEERSFASAMMSWYECEDRTVDQCHQVGYSPEAELARLNWFHNRNRLHDRPQTPRQVAAMLDTFSERPRPGQFRLLDFIALGGAVNDHARTDTAYVHRTASFMAGVSGGLNDAGYTSEDEHACQAWMARGFSTIDTNSLRESYQNFIDPALSDWRPAYYGENYRRLVRAKKAYDPHRFFRFAQAIG
ncbi:MAG TPA: FAD-binding oxidoreductase [Streptomyces sp.]|uniref:FAD-binding oxidoreductase n=1 Tax=Streptomyces sp. TaxID=1931 RepID=UPI002C133824|nr:FAD-binding oxidoreductase [Streptomyces sp.]HWU11087.1 FAD-binding oxidoreductase [Streptomyces sp.]